MADSRVQVGSSANYLATQTRVNDNGHTVHAEEVTLALGVARTTILGIATSASGDATLVAATAAKKHYIWKLRLHAAAAVVITFKSAAAALPGPITFDGAGDIILDLDGEPWFACAPNEALVINLSVAVAVTGAVHYTTQP